MAGRDNETNAPGEYTYLGGNGKSFAFIANKASPTITTTASEFQVLLFENGANVGAPEALFQIWIAP